MIMMMMMMMMMMLVVMIILNNQADYLYGFEMGLYKKQMAGERNAGSLVLCDVYVFSATAMPPVMRVMTGTV